ncbi:MAG: magnesium chelatase subunit H, partial [Oscillochloris sp.]|nr:magnesium chelatase subunit H [Oscillochloris sp.]
LPISPNLGNVGTAAYLDVFQSLFELLRSLKADGYTVELPGSADELRRMIVEGNALTSGTDSNVAARLPLADYRRLFPAEADIEPFWGRAPGQLLNDGSNFYILGRQLGNVFIGVQPSFGYERDPMRLLMAKDAAPNHAFAAFYAWLRYVYQADAVVHFGTHGALEFMPGKQVGMGATCWPSRLIGELPNFYYYSVNNPSEAAIAKRRSAATLISYLVPPLQQAGLYKGLRALKDTLDRYRSAPDAELLEDIRVQAEKLGMNAEIQSDNPDSYVGKIGHELLKIEERMIPAGLHVLGKSPAPAELVDFLNLTASFRPAGRKSSATFPALVAAGVGYDYAALRERIASDTTAQEQWRQVETICKEAIRHFVESAHGDRQHRADHYLRETARIAPGTLHDMWLFLGDLLAKLLAPQEVQGLLHGLRGGFIQPSPSNDVVRDPGVLPTGRNVYSLDPYRVPSMAAMERGGRLVNELLARLVIDQGSLPQTVAVVLWGSDNLKSECEGVAQVLWLFGARPLIDELGSVTDVSLIPLAELGRPRVDAVVTVSGIFRDLLGNQMQLIDKAAHLAALADEPAEQNFVRAHALAQAAELGIPIEEAASRVFSNAPGSYGANVNNLVDSGTWDDDTQLGEAFLSRKSFSLGPNGQWRESRAVLEKALGTVDASFQNIDSFEVGLSDIDNYYD